MNIVKLLKIVTSLLLFIISPISFAYEFPATPYWIAGDTVKNSSAAQACVHAESVTGYAYIFTYLVHSLSNGEIVPYETGRGSCLGRRPNQTTSESMVYSGLGRSHYCPTTTTYMNSYRDSRGVPQLNCVILDPPIPPKNKGGCSDGCSCVSGGAPSTNNPIKIGSGNKWLSEVDNGKQAQLSLVRYYNAHYQYMPNSIGKGWTQTYSKLITSGVSYEASVHRADGKAFTFKLVNNNWISDAGVSDKLIEQKDAGGIRTGWIYKVDATDEAEGYNANGKLLSIADRSGLTRTLYYSDSTTPTSITFSQDLLIKLTDSLGRQLNFTYDNFNRIKAIADTDGGVTLYNYDTNQNLTSVTYPDGKTKTYLYGEASNVSATPNAGVSNASLLTGITDENGIRYASYWYDAQGRAYKEELAPGLALNIEKNELVYNTNASGNPTTTVVTDSRGSARTYNFTTILGVVKSTGQSQPAGSGCAASAAALTYDINGNVASRTDFKGNKTTYAYDMRRNLETSRTEGLTSAGTATSSTRTISTTWHTIWRLPLVTAEYTGVSATGTALRTTTNVYDAKGNITSITEADPVRALTRTNTITYTYSSLVPGLVIGKVVNGSRTDVVDTTTYNYYDADVTCTPSSAAPIINPITGLAPDNLGCRGQLSSLTNALNRTTSYDRYNHHGQVEQMTDANGLVTTSTYDLRQRLISRTVGNEITSLIYDDAGQVIQLTMPDASTLTYSYDAAHRLTEVQDILGNKVTYTLDTEGNRINEVTTDPLGGLAKTITRSYDALNRLQQVTGVE